MTSPGALAGFLLDHPGNDDDPIAYWIDGSITLGSLRTAAQRAAAAVRASDIPAGGHVAAIVESGVSALAAMFGVWLAGAVYVPVNSRLTDTEIRHQLSAGDIAAVIGRPGRDLGVDDRFISEGMPLHWSPSRSAVVSGSDTDVALVMRTSGTTGESKPVILTHSGVADGIDTVLASLRSSRTPTDGPARAPMPNLIPSSLALWAGGWNALFALRAGAPMVLMDRFDSGDFATLVRRHGIRSSVLAPAMMSMLVDDPAVTDLAPLTMARSITAPLTPQQARSFSAKFGVAVMNCYGQTELGSEVVGWTPRDLREFGESKLGAVGRAHTGVELAILDDDHAPVAPGEVGELWVRSPFASTSPDVATRLVDGFLRTGDFGRVDADGFLWLQGRVSDMINRGGMKVMPQEIEDELRSLPGVADACVAGVPDERLGEVPVAWVRATPGATIDPAALLTALRANLAGYKLPVEVIEVADFPRNEIGKILRHALTR